MSAPLVPSPLDYIGRKSFAFYPPIGHAHPNSWILGAGSWSEVQVINAQSGREVWVPRQFIGAVSDHGDALVVGLTQQVDLRNGEIVPRAQRRVIQMPLPEDVPLTHHARVTHHADGPADVIGIRLEKKAPNTFQRPPFRVGLCVLFVAGLLALVASASR
jgi:hypothetical protein